MSGKRIIAVIGGDGQLGQCLQAVFREEMEYSLLLPSLAELDITNKKQVESFFKNNAIDALVNCAAYTQVDNAESESDLAYLVNATAPGQLAKKCSEYEIRMIHISTDYVFSGQNYKPYAEEDLTEPVSVYGQTKLDGEKAVLESSGGHIVLRTSWLYSEYAGNFMKTILRLAGEREELSIVADQIGTPTYALSLAETIHRIIDKYPKLSGLFHFSNQGVASWYDFATSIVEFADLKCQVAPITTVDYPTAAARPHFSLLDKQKICSTLELDISHWQVDLKRCLARMAENGPRIEVG